MRAPVRKVGDDGCSADRVERLGHLTRHGDEDLLKRLDTEASVAGLPQFRKDGSCPVPLLAGGLVVRVHQDIGVHEAAVTGHAAPPGSSGPDPRCLGLAPLLPAPDCALWPLRTPPPVPPLPPSSLPHSPPPTPPHALPP